jgi:hypothetical protein
LLPHPYYYLNPQILIQLCNLQSRYPILLAPDVPGKAILSNQPKIAANISITITTTIFFQLTLYPPVKAVLGMLQLGCHKKPGISST